MEPTSTQGYTVYCDESRHDGSSRNPYMAIGGLWVLTAQKEFLIKELRSVLKTHALGAEVKWSKTSSKKLEAYKAIIDFFFRHELRFRVIVVEQARLKYEQFKGGDEELGFYSFYFEMLNKWLHLPVPYNLLLDFKKNKGADHYQVLQRCLTKKVPNGTTIKGVRMINSADSPLAQLSDILIGATAASWCGIPTGTPKADLAAYIAKHSQRDSLTVIDPKPLFSKLNIFRIDLQ